MVLFLSKYDNRAAMLREVGGLLVTHFADLHSYSRSNSGGVQNGRGRLDEHTLHDTVPVKVC